MPDTAMENFNPHYGDRYFSDGDGPAESRWVFAGGNSLATRGLGDCFAIGETGFGTGLNLLVAAAALASRGLPRLSYASVEQHPLAAADVASLLGPWKAGLDPLYSTFLEAWTEMRGGMVPGWNRKVFSGGSMSIDLKLFAGDVHDALASWPETADAWFLDGHDPARNPDMWSEGVFAGIAAFSRAGTSLSSYTAKGTVKQGLRRAGFRIVRGKGFGGKRHMIRGVFTPP